jgi:hypothetical protein
MNKFGIEFSKKHLLALVVSILCYLLLSYGIERSSFYVLLALYTVLFALFLFLVYENKTNEKFLLSLSFLFRILLLFAIPNLSDDFYRFIWDGRMIWEGFNPYLFLPENDTSLVTEGQKLYDGMGSMNGSHYTCYPPVNQLTFLVPAILFSKNLLGATVVMRLLIILADFGTYLLGKKILELLKLPSRNIFLYILNPFIILELTGNLHFEGVMLFFLAVAIYYLLKNKWIISAFYFAISVSVKLIPLLFLPVLIKKLGVKKTVLYGGIVLLFTVLFFLPFVSHDLYENFMKSIHLYFQNFEFNASIYYIVREIGFQVKGYNIIHAVGKVTPFIVATTVLVLSFARDNKNYKVLFETLLFSICIYYSLASIVHPWYIAIPLFFSIFTKYKFPLVWSFMVILSYFAYQNTTYQENLYLVATEYVIVYTVFFYELFILRGRFSSCNLSLHRNS